MWLKIYTTSKINWKVAKSLFKCKNVSENVRTTETLIEKMHSNGRNAVEIIHNVKIVVEKMHNVENRLEGGSKKFLTYLCIFNAYSISAIVSTVLTLLSIGEKYKDLACCKGQFFLFYILQFRLIQVMNFRLKLKQY